MKTWTPHLLKAEERGSRFLVTQTPMHHLVISRAVGRRVTLAAGLWSGQAADRAPPVVLIGSGRCPVPILQVKLIIPRKLGPQNSKAARKKPSKVSLRPLRDRQGEMGGGRGDGTT